MLINFASTYSAVDKVESHSFDCKSLPNEGFCLVERNPTH